MYRTIVYTTLAIGLSAVVVRAGAQASPLVRRAAAGLVQRASEKGSAQVTTLYVFQGPPDAGHPDAPVTYHDGELYGITSWGGPAGLGAVYKLTPSGSTYAETVLHAFAGGKDGSRPYYGVTVRGDDVYGSTTAGGGSTTCSGGCGTLFKLTKRRSAPSGYVEHIIYRFQGGSDGSNPDDPPIVDGRGTLYGTTSGGGGSTACSGGCGTIFKLARTPSGYVETTLYRFQGGNDGSAPLAPLIVDRAGAFYGTTLTGGGSTLCPQGCGTVFKLTPSSSGYVETVVHHFKGGADGAGIFSGVISDRRGTLFGTAALGGGHYPGGCQYNGISPGCGLVYKITRDRRGYRKHTLYMFSDASNDGAGPWGGVTFGPKGTLYGTSVFGGNCGVASFGCGTAYQLTRQTAGNYQFTLLYSFPGYAAAFPYAPMIYVNGALYGTSAQGGVGSCDPTSYACGTVFKLIP
jgi:uncharacterized repeat protein (TIGR03803 family)